MLVPPSPNVHDWFVIVPVEVSVKVTVSGATPLVGLALNLATGVIAPIPVTAFVALPPLLAKATEPVNDPAEPGLKLTFTCPVCPPPTLNGLPLTSPKLVPDTVTVPVNAIEPPLITENVCVLT